MTEWYSSVVFAEGRDVLYQICGYMTKRILSLIHVSSSPEYLLAPKSVLASAKKKDFMLCVKMVTINCSNRYAV